MTKPPIENGALYSCIRPSELIVLTERIIPGSNRYTAPKRHELKNMCNVQFGIGTHASEKHRVLGSVLLSGNWGTGVEINIQYIALADSF